MESDVRKILEDCSLERLQGDLKVLETVREGIFQGKYESEERPGKQYGICYGIKKALESVEENYGKPVLFTHNLAIKYGNAIPGNEGYFWWLTDIHMGDILAGKCSAKETDGFVFDKQRRVEFLDWMIAQYREQIWEVYRKDHDVKIPVRLEKALKAFGEGVPSMFRVNMVNRFPTFEELQEKCSLLYTYETLSRMLEKAFVWCDTPEGYDYWSAINGKLRKDDELTYQLFDNLPSLFRSWLAGEDAQVKLGYLDSLRTGSVSPEELLKRPLKDAINAPFVWCCTPEGQKFWEKLNLKWSKFLEEEENKVVYVPLSEIRKIFDVACRRWKKELTIMTTMGMDSPVSEVVKIYISDIKRMFEAADKDQRKVLVSVFGEEIK